MSRISQVSDIRSSFPRKRAIYFELRVFCTLPAVHTCPPVVRVLFLDVVFGLECTEGVRPNPAIATPADGKGR
jgi:hypothetical protein